MRVRLKTIMAGPGGTFKAGSIIALPSDQARELIEGGFAEAVPGKGLLPADVETATAEPPENAMRPTPTRRKGRQ